LVFHPRSGRPYMVPLYRLPTFFQPRTAMLLPMLMVSPYWSRTSDLREPNQRGLRRRTTYHCTTPTLLACWLLRLPQGTR
jgi:hypothetical protein